MPPASGKARDPVQVAAKGEEMSNCTHVEPTLDEILSDSAVKALMLADGVNPVRLRDKLLRLGAARGLEAPPPRRSGAELPRPSRAAPFEAALRLG